MSILGDAVVIGSGGETATIVVTSATGSTVTCTTPSGITLTATEVSGTWTFARLKQYGTYTVTATDGTMTYSRTVVVDAAQQYPVTVYPGTLYWEGDENVAVTYYSLSSSGSITNTSEHIASRYVRGGGLGSYNSYAEQDIITSNKIDVTNYTKLYCNYRHYTYPRSMTYIYSTNSIITPTNNTGGMRSGTTAIASNKNANGAFTDEIDISALTGEMYLYVRSMTNAGYGGGNDISTDFYRLWLE